MTNGILPPTVQEITPGTSLPPPPDPKKMLKLGTDFNIEVTKNTIRKKLPMWVDYTNRNVQRLEKIGERLKRKGHKRCGIASQTIERLRPLFLMRPCLVIGFGNSFHECVDLIKQVPRDKVTIVSTDRPLRKLYENGVIPDLVVNLDSGPQIRPFFQFGMSIQDKMKMNACLAITTHPDEVKWFAGKKYWYIPAITPWENRLTEETIKKTNLPCVPTAGNVGTTAVMISKICGAKPIFLTGFDFGREIFEKADPLATDDKLATSKEFEVILPNGRTFITDPVLHAYAFSTRKLMHYYDIDCYNMSGGILHGKYILTVEPTPEQKGSSRDRFKTFLKEINEWEMSAEITLTREKFAKGKLSIPINYFWPQRNRKMGPEEFGLATEQEAEALAKEVKP